MRAHFKHRAAAVDRPANWPRPCGIWPRGETPLHRLDGSEPRVVFLFTGQGSQFAGMARALDADEPIFRDIIDRCDAIFQDEFGTDLRALLWGDGEDGRLDETAFTQPALYAVECALTALWRSWGVALAAVIGHSVGEFAAMQAAGVLSLEDGFRLVVTRGRMMQALCERGAMAAVTASETRIRDLLGDLPADLSIAAVNASDDVVLSGVPAALDAALDRLGEQGVRHRRLMVSHAFHSPLMEPMLEGFAEYAAEIPLRSADDPADLEPDRVLARRRSGCVLLASACAGSRALRGRAGHAQGRRPHDLPRSGSATGPAGHGPPIRPLRRHAERPLASVAAQDRRRRPGNAGGRGRALSGGRSDRLAGVRGGRGRRTALPTYPFERQRFWLDDVAASPDLAPTAHALGLSEAPAAPWTPAPSVSTAGGQRLRVRTPRRQSRRPIRPGCSTASSPRSSASCALPAKPDLKQGLFELGMDSLMAVELRSRLEAGLGQALPPTIAFDHPTIERLARHLLDLIAPSGAAPAAGLRKADPQAPIAIVGMGCRFPGGANDPDSFWRLLRDGSLLESDEDIREFQAHRVGGDLGTSGSGPDVLNLVGKPPTQETFNLPP